MTGCPLPIDWLDLRDGRPRNASHKHLDICPSCRAVAALLDEQAPESDGPNTAALIQLAAMQYVPDAAGLFSRCGIR